MTKKKAKKPIGVPLRFARDPVFGKDVTMFNLRPEPNSGSFWRVVVFAKKRDMIDYYNTLRAPFSLKGFEAVTMESEIKVLKKKKWCKTGIVGQVIFCRQELGTGTVAHEMFHAVMFYGRKRKWRFRVNNDGYKWLKSNERIAWCVGYMTREFWRKYYKLHPILATRCIKKERY